MADPFQVNADDLKRLQKDLNKALKRLPQLRQKVGNMARARIGARALSTYMQEGPKTRTKGDTGPLIKQTARLARAVAGGRESKIRTEVSNNVWTMILTIMVPYAAVHEFGKSNITIPVTAKMRGFFWHMFRETGDEKYKWMALTKKTVFTITMPARPYIRPSIKDEGPEILKRTYDIVIAFLNAEI